MIFARPLSARASGSKGMRLSRKMVVCLGLRVGDVYGVGLEGEDQDSEDEDLEQARAVANSSSSDLLNPSAVPSTSSNPVAQLVFGYDVDEAVLKAMERGRLHEWTKVEFKAISRKHGLSVSGGKGELMERVTVHFQRLYQL